MAIQKINLGTEPHGVGGDSYRTANEKINSNFEEVGKDIKDVLDVVQKGDFAKSAYDIAVKNGFVGSESAWLSSLIGQKGEKGVGVVNVIHNNDDTLTFNFTDNTRYTTRSLKGEQGIQGPEAKSVYDIAVSHGFKGDEKDWLNYVFENLEVVENIYSDARSLSEFMYKPANFTVTRRLAPSIHTLQYYLDSLDNLKNVNIRDIVIDALDATVIADGGVSSALVTTTNLQEGTVKRTLDTVLNEKLTPKDFGVVGDGITDDTVGIKAYHEYCNAKNIKADYSGVGSLVIQADARIPVNTDVDFHSTPIRAIGAESNVDLPWSSPPKLMYIIEDIDTPVITQNNVALSGTHTGTSLSFLRDLDIDKGFVNVTCNRFFIPRRYASKNYPLLNYQQSFHLANKSSANSPLSAQVDMSNVNIDTRKDSKRGYLTLKNPCYIQDNNAHRIIFLNIWRNQVEVDGLNIIEEVDVTGSNHLTYVDVVSASEFKFSNFSGSGITGGDSAYILNMSNVANVVIRNVSSDNGWGWMGANHINGVLVENCFLNRFDAHSGVHNLTVRNSRFIDIGISVGWAGGNLLVDNCHFHYCGVLGSRGDYYAGRGWNKISIENSYVYGGTGIIDINGVGNYDDEESSSIMPMPIVKHIYINNVHLDVYAGKPQGAPSPHNIIKINAPTGLAKTLPIQTVTVTNIKTTSQGKLVVNIPFNSFDNSLFPNGQGEMVAVFDNISSNGLDFEFGSSLNQKQTNLNISISNIKASTTISTSSHIRKLKLSRVDDLKIPTLVKNETEVTDNEGVVHTHRTFFEVRDSIVYGALGKANLIGVQYSSSFNDTYRPHGSVFFNNRLSRIVLESGVTAMAGNEFIDGSKFSDELKARINESIPSNVLPDKSLAFYGWQASTKYIVDFKPTTPATPVT